MEVKNNSDSNLYRVLLSNGNNLLRESPAGKKEPMDKKPSDDVFIIDAKLWKALMATGGIGTPPSSAPKPPPTKVESEPIISTEDPDDLYLEVVQPMSSMPEMSYEPDVEFGFFETQSSPEPSYFEPIDPSMLVSRFNPRRPIFKYNKDNPKTKYVKRLGVPPSIDRHRRR